MKLKMLSGLPGSGKTTKARELVDQGQGGRINRDDLRAMLFNSKWSGKREGIVIDIEKAIAKILKENNLAPIIDDTNLTIKNRSMWQNFAKENGFEFIEEYLDTSIDKCIERDSLRIGKSRVGPVIIWRWALLTGQIHFGDKPIVITDLDGTVCDGSHREEFLKGNKKDWDSYFSLCGEDKPVDAVIRWLQNLSEENTIIAVSGRPDHTQFETLDWLDRHNVPFKYLFMRASSDKRSDVEVKQAILDFLPKSRINFVLDDRPAVIEGVWRKNNIKVYPVRGAVEPF